MSEMNDNCKGISPWGLGYHRQRRLKPDRFKTREITKQVNRIQKAPYHLYKYQMVPPKISVLGLIRLHFNSVFTKKLDQEKKLNA